MKNLVFSYKNDIVLQHRIPLELNGSLIELSSLDYIRTKKDDFVLGLDKDNVLNTISNTYENGKEKVKEWYEDFKMN